MATALLKCRVCGKEYHGCRTIRTANGVFNWQKVACSPECGAIYLDGIRKSRAKTNVAVAQDPEQEAAFALFEDEYKDEMEDEELYDESDDSEEIEIEV